MRRGTGNTWWPFGGAALTAVVLGALGVIPRWPGVVHSVALPPFDLAFDLRVLLTRAPSYPVFAAGLVLSLAARSVILTSLLGVLGAPGSVAKRLGLSLRFYLVALIPVGLGAGLEYSATAAFYHWFFWAGLGGILVTFLLLAAVPFEGALRGTEGVGRGLGRTARRGFRLGPVLAYLGGLLGLGAAADGAGEWGAIPLVLVSAVLTYGAAVWLARPRSTARLPRPVAAVLALLLVLPGTAFAGSRSAPADAALLLVGGVDSESGRGSIYLLDAGTLAFGCDRVFYYSYRGLGPGAPQGEARCPLRDHAPYAREDTQRPLGELVRAFSEQVAAISEDAGGRRVIVITHSQGAWIAWRAVARGLAPDVSHLVLLGGFPWQPVSYPPEGRDGAGRVGSDLLRVVSDYFRGRGTATFDPDAPLARRLQGTAGAVEAIFAEGLPGGVRALTISATFDAPLMPEGRSIPGVPDEVVDTVHVGLTESASTIRTIRAFLEGKDVGGTRPVAAVLDAVLPAFGVPF